MEVREVDNNAVREGQLKRLSEVKAKRDEKAVQAALEAITTCAKTKEGNLLELAVDAARKRATLGEISDAMEKEFGRYKAVIRSISGVYSGEVKKNEDFIAAQAAADLSAPS